MKKIVFLIVMSLLLFNSCKKEDSSPTAPVNKAPNQPVVVLPQDGAKSQSVSLSLSWVCTDPNNDQLIYDVYLETTNPPLMQVASERSLTNFQTNALLPSTKYYWKVVAKDKSLSTASAIWSFITADSTGTASISGKVTDSSNQAIEGAKVYTSPKTSNVYTDASGNFAITNIAGGSYTVNAEKTGYTNYSFNITVIQNQAVTQNITMTEFIVGSPCVGTPTVTYAGKIYNTVQIGTQCWMKENLDVGTMVQGSDTTSNNGTIEKYCYDNNTANCDKYGGLYKWKEAMAYSTTPGAKGICPDGWHIPTKAEFETLAAAVNNNGNALKAVGQGTESGAGTNTSGFSALLAGYRNFDGVFFYDLGYDTSFWSSTEYFMTIYFIGSNIYFYNTNENYGLSVRCIKD